MPLMEYAGGRHIGEILKDRNIILKGADIVTAQGFTQVPNFLLRSKKLSAGDKMTFAMLLSYAWQNDYCFPGQLRLAADLGLHETNVRKHLKSLQAIGLLTIVRRGQGKTNIYQLNLKPKYKFKHSDRAKTLGLDRAKRGALDRTKTLDTP